MASDDIIGYVFLFLIVVVPILGVTARLAIKPMVDALLRLREGFPVSSPNIQLERHVLELENEVRHLRAEVQRLREADTFHRELLPDADELARPKKLEPSI